MDDLRSTGLSLAGDPSVSGIRAQPRQKAGIGRASPTWRGSSPVIPRVDDGPTTGVERSRGLAFATQRKTTDEH